MNKLVREVVVVVICAAIFALMPMFLLGQASPGKIVGTVKDPDGAVVSGVDVSLLNPLQAAIRTTATDASGNFTFDDIVPGNYQLKVTSSGFAPYRAAIQVRGSYRFGEGSEVSIDFENIFDKSYRGISWGIDGAGRGVTLRYRYQF